MNKKILVVDDELSMREFLDILLQDEGYLVDTAENGKMAVDRLKKSPYHLIITDIQMPGMTGIDLLKEVKAISPETEVLMMTAYASAESAVEAMKRGAYDYITKPFKIDEIKLIVGNVFEKISLRRENILLKAELKEEYSFGNLIGVSSEMREVYDLIKRAAPTRTTVLITGESGTGKELVAKSIHLNSDRKDKPIVTVNCGAVPENLLESELFGHIKGAFTGAIANKAGLFELADGGTLFLDEIGEIPIQLQVKLLRVIQEKEYRRVGDVKDVSTDVRIIAASNRDLEQAAKEGRFREDLFYRLNVIQIRLPALRERKGDVPSLANHFLAKYNKELGRDIKRIATETMDLLRNYDYPGNVRELENIIERAVALERSDVILAESLSDRIRGKINAISMQQTYLPAEGIDMEAVMNAMERKLLLSSLEKAGGVKTKAAALLNLSFRSFRYRLAKLGLDSDDAD